MTLLRNLPNLIRNTAKSHLPRSRHSSLAISSRFNTQRNDMNPNDIFANNQLNMSDINVYGFDYDYTLAAYTENKVEQFIHKQALMNLVKDKLYPTDLLKIQYDENFVIRGLHYDIENQLLMKLDSYSVINQPGLYPCYRGRKPIGYKEISQTYHSRNIPVWKLEASQGVNAQFSANTFHPRASRFYHVADRFSVAEMTLIADVNEYFATHRMRHDSKLVFEDIQEAISKVHISGSLYNEITNNIDDYLVRGSLKSLLEHFKKHKKQLFILTNSPFKFVDAGMKCLLDEKNWVDYFDLVICQSKKPGFFTKRDAKFRTSGKKWALGGEPRPEFQDVRKLQKGYIYHGGCLRELQRLTGWQPHETLFFGDHLYADLADAILNVGWRTGCIVPELEREINVINSDEFKQNVTKLITLEKYLEFEQKINKNTNGPLIDRYKQERREIKEELRDMFNPYFGSIFRCNFQTSYFHRRLSRFAEIYTSKIENLAEIPIDTTLYPRRSSLPHEYTKYT